MDFSTTYMGLKLKNPLVASASPLSENLNNFRKLEDAGIAAIVKHSLFEEQLTKEAETLQHRMSQGTDSFAEALTYFPRPDDYVLGPDEYLDHIRKAKAAVGIPIIASLNGYTSGGWTRYARYMQEAGADAIELNIYYIASDPEVTSTQVEENYVQILKSVKDNIKIPVALKLGPYFSSMAHMARRLDQAGADGLVLFNRFYQPDINLENLEVEPSVILSTSFASRLPLRWIAILYGRVKASLAATSGIHHADDVIKMIMAGADATMLCSTLLKNGIKHADVILKTMREWMEENGYDSIQQMKGSMSQKSCADPQAFERANYMKVLQSYKIDL